MSRRDSRARFKSAHLSRGARQRRLTNHSRHLAVIPLEKRELLSLTAFPELPGLHLVDPDNTRIDGQVVYLDFDGAQNITYGGPVTVNGIDVPAFIAPSSLAPDEDTVIASIVGRLQDTFSSTGIVFTVTRPEGTASFSTIYIGGDGAQFSKWGSFLGLAEDVDVGNLVRNDMALVFAQNLDATSAERYTETLAGVIAHEVGHLLGFEHASAQTSGHVELADVAAQVDIQASGDVYVSKGAPTVNFSEYPRLDVYAPVPQIEYRSLIKFDIGSIPAGSTITSAELRLYATTANNATVTAHRLTSSWNESTVTWNGLSWIIPRMVGMILITLGARVQMFGCSIPAQTGRLR